LTVGEFFASSCEKITEHTMSSNNFGLIDDCSSRRGHRRIWIRNLHDTSLGICAQWLTSLLFARDRRVDSGLSFFCISRSQWCKRSRVGIPRRVVQSEFSFWFVFYQGQDRFPQNILLDATVRSCVSSRQNSRRTNRQEEGRGQSVRHQASKRRGASSGAPLCPSRAYTLR